MFSPHCTDLLVFPACLKIHSLFYVRRSEVLFSFLGGPGNVSEYVALGENYGLESDPGAAGAATR